MSFAKWIYWLQINFYCMQFSQHETLHCYSSVTVNPSQSYTRKTATTTWTACLLKSYLKKPPNCELSLDDLKEPFLALSKATAMRGKLYCSCTYCSSLMHKSGNAEPSSAGLFFTPHSDSAALTGSAHGGRKVCVLAASQDYSLQKVLSERKNKTEEAKMNNYIII